MIAFKNVTVLRAGKSVLNDFSMLVEKGKMAVIYGGSGSGKSTICDLILGKIQAQSGVVELNGMAVNQSQNKVGAITPSLELLNDRTLSENIALPLEIAGVNKSRITSAVNAVIDRLGLTNVDETPSAVSGSSRQKAAIARAVISEPFVLIADEPTLHLDRAASEEIATILLKEQVRGMAVVVLTSNSDFAALFPNAAHIRLEA